jgi:hypothetical protein
MRALVAPAVSSFVFESPLAAPGFVLGRSRTFQASARRRTRAT